MLLQCKNLTKTIGTDEILCDVSFIVEEKEKVALVGVNGAGKTSVFRLLTGEWQPDGGIMTLAAGTRVGYLPQLNDMGQAEDDRSDRMGEQAPRASAKNGTSHSTDPDVTNDPSERGTASGITLYEELDSVFEPLQRMEAELRRLETEMGALEGEAQQQSMERYARLSERFEAQGGYEQASRVRGVLKGLGFTEDEGRQPLGTLSGGQRTRTALGKLLLTSPGLLLLDEPTNHLDIESVAWLEDYLRGYAGAMVVISHDRYFLDRVVTKTVEVEHKKTHVYNGNYSFFAHHKAADREVALRQYVQQQKVIRHHEEVIKTLRSYRTEAAIIRAKSREKLLDKIERVEKPDSLPDNMRLMLTPKLQSGYDVLNIENLRMGFDNKMLFEDLSFEVKRGDRMAVVGANGIGKTTLFKIIVGEIKSLAGKTRWGVNVRVGYYDQAQQRLSDGKTVFEELADTYPALTQTEIRNVLAAFIFTGDDVFKPISALSGGERGRVSLAKIMLGGANFLILDEPTNHLDMFSKEILEEALRDFPGTLLYISHDRYFINHVSTKVMELSSEGLTAYLGNYDDYVEKKRLLAAEREAALSEERRQSPPKANGSTENSDRVTAGDSVNYRRKKESESEARRYKSRLARLEAEIAETEAAIADRDALLNGEAASDAEAAAALFEEKTALEAKLDALYEEWDAIMSNA